MLDDGLDEVGCHLDLADAGLGLGVGDVEAGAVGVVEAHLADAQLAQLADPHPGSAKDLADDAPAGVAAAGLDAEPAQVPAHGGLRDAEAPCDRGRHEALGVQVGDQSGGRAEVGGRRWSVGRVLRGCRVEQRGQLVHLQERAAWLRYGGRHPLRASCAARLPRAGCAP